MNKIIVSVGVHDVRESTNISMCKAFYRLGFGVIPVNYRTIIKNHGMSTFEEVLLEVVKKYKPFLTIYSKCNSINPEIITRCNDYSISWLFNMDPAATIERCPEVIEHAKRAHFSSCTGEDIALWFMKSGVKQCYHLIQGVDQDVFKPMPINASYKTDISFIGNKTEERERFKNILEKNGFDVRFYGNGFEKEVINEEFATVCSSSKVMLSMNTINNVHRKYFSNRLLRYMACGSCVLHYDSTSTLGQFFENKKDIIYFKDEDELMNILKNITDESIYKIGIDGRERVLSNFTWEHINSAMINTVIQSME